MIIPEDIANSIYDQVLKANKILIISHRNPDADTIGSNFALRILFEKLGKKVTSACRDENPYNCTFLSKQYSLINKFKFSDYDLIFAVDAGSIAQTFFLDKIPKKPIINIDHHPSNNNYGTTNLVIDDAASTTTIIYFLLKKWNKKITPGIASCLLFGLYYDTGSFMHSNTNDKIFYMAGELLKAGAKHEQIIKILYKQKSLAKMKLWGKVLSNARLTNKKIVISGVKNKDYEDCNASIEDLSGVIDYLSTAKGNHFTTLLTEDGNGNIKGSFRTRHDDINLARLAETFGGGGHKKASGFEIKGKLRKETKLVILQENDPTKN